MLKRKYPGSVHNHTDHSNNRLRDCINKVSDLIDYAIELGHECVAITDHETLSSFIQVEKYAEKVVDKENNIRVKDKIKIIRGNEIYLTRNKLNGSNFNKERGDDYFHFVLLAKDIEGYHQLCELSTRAWKRSYISRRMRRVPTYYQDLKDVIGKNPGHIIGSTACLGGQLPKFLLKYRETGDTKYWETAINWCQYMVGIFGEGNFFLEMQPSKNVDQEFVNLYICKIHDETGIPLIITTDSHYLKKEDAYIHEKYLNSQDGDREVKSFYETTYMMDTEELESYFYYVTLPYLEEAYANIRKIADMCEDYSIKRPLRIPCLPWIDYEHNVPDLDFYVSKMPTLQKFIDSPHAADNELVYATIAGIKKHEDLQNDEAYDALEECLEMTWISSEVNNAQWSAYYLNLQKIIEECWNAGSIVGCARGSGGGFVLLYCLDIIQVNCLRETTKCFPWRFLNPKRVSVLDIDFDISGLKRAQVLEHLRKVYGEDRVCNVATFRTEKSKSAIITAARGLNMTPEDGQYFASLVTSERGQLYSLKKMYYGSEKDGIAPSTTFVQAMDEHPDLWRIAQKIEGLICGVGIHAGGIVFNDEPFTNTAALMRAPDGTIISAFELHDLEECSLIKYDALSVEGMDRIQVCLELLQEYGYVEPEATLKETYEKVIGIYNIERDDPKMWKKIWDHEIVSLFQMEQQSGLQGIALSKPKNVNDLAVLNSVIRLMAPEKGAEQPLEMWARYRKNPNAWIREMKAYGLSEENILWLSNHSAITDGICESQEGLMSLVQEPRLGGNDLTFADKCRKGLAKKIGQIFDECEKTYFSNAEKLGCDDKLVHYVWDVMLKVQRGYSFNRSHCLAYSLVALQEMNLAHKYPIIFWNTANLIVDSAGKAETEEGDDECIIVELEDAPEEAEEIVDIYEPEEWEEYEYEDLPDKTAKKKKKKTKSINFGKIATAIGKFQTAGITITPPDINKSGFTFTPLIEENSIASGLRNITRISADLVNQIIANRPYTSLEDFQSKVKVNRTQMLMLLKCGAFDNLYPDRMKAIEEYLATKAATKTKLTLANVPMLMKYNVFDEEAAEYLELYSYNKFLRKHIIEDKIVFPEKALDYYCNHYDIDLLIDGNSISVKNWEKIYKKGIAPLADFIKSNMEELLAQLNEALISEQFESYAKGTISHYEIESMSFYYHEHELKHANPIVYELVDFNMLPTEPVVDKIIPTKDGKNITLYQLDCICGTVLDKNKLKNSVTLLTPSGVVTVKIWKNQFAKYDKQISEVQPDGTKKVREKSWFSRGNLLYLQGIRRGDAFIPKAYKSSPHKIPIMKILSVDGDTFTFTDKRYDEL